MEDVVAIRRLKRGDLGGLECLIARYQEKALRAAFLVTHDEPMARRMGSTSQTLPQATPHSCQAHPEGT